MHTFRKVLCASLSLAMLSCAVCACSKSDKDDDDKKSDSDSIEDVVADYLDNLLKYKLSKNEKLVEDGDDAVAGMDCLDSRYQPVIEAILTTASYEITDTDEKHSEVEFDLNTVDIEAVFDLYDGIYDIDELAECIEDNADDEDIFETESFTFELIEDDGEWLIASDSTGDLADYLDELIEEEVEGFEAVTDITEETDILTPPDTEPVETEPTDATEPTVTEVTEPTETVAPTTPVVNIEGATYVGTIDLTDYLMQSLEESGISASSFTPVGTFGMEMTLVLGDDGTFSLSCDGQKVIDEMAEFYSNNLLGMMAAAYGMSESDIEALLTSSGMSIDSLLQEQIAGTSTAQFDRQVTGTYVISGNEIIFNGVSGGTEYGATINGDQVTMTWPDDSFGQCTIVFNKVG